MSKPYSTDGFNLLTKMGDCKGNQTLYTYKPGTNLLIKKLIFDKGTIKKRTFQTYNNDGVCIKTIEDDGSKEEESKIYDWSVTERHIKEIKPKEILFENSTYYEYDAFHRLIKVIHPEVLDQNNQIIRPTFNYAYDLFGNSDN